MHRRVAGGGGVAALIGPLVFVVGAPIRTAHAFCRSTTMPVPVSYDPVASGCWTQGTPLAWGVQRIPYVLAASASRQITLAQATKVADLAFGVWNQAACPQNAMRHALALDDGPVGADAAADDCGLRECDPRIHDSQHVIVFRDDAWPHNDPNNTLAITTVTYGSDSGEIFDADIEINSAQHALSADQPSTAGSFDLQAILTHEAGHFFGLAHATSTQSVMYAQYQAGAVRLTADDVAGLCSIYPPTSPGCDCSLSRGQSHGGGAFAAAIVLVVADAVRRRRKRARVRR